MGGAAPHSVAALSRWPAGFDEAEFVRHAKLNFVRLQATHDQRDLATIRDFVTPDLYREIEADVEAAGTATQQTEVVTLNAEVLDVATEAEFYVVSVRFSGLIRETAGEAKDIIPAISRLSRSEDPRVRTALEGIVARP